MMSSSALMCSGEEEGQWDGEEVSGVGRMGRRSVEWGGWGGGQWSGEDGEEVNGVGRMERRSAEWEGWGGEASGWEDGEEGGWEMGRRLEGWGGWRRSVGW